MPKKLGEVFGVPILASSQAVMLVLERLKGVWATRLFCLEYEIKFQNERQAVSASDIAKTGGLRPATGFAVAPDLAQVIKTKLLG